MGALRNLKAKKLEGDLLLYNEDCVDGSRKYIPPQSIDLVLNDPPFGIGETHFGSYNRDSSYVRDGYGEAPKDSQGYFRWTKAWMAEAFRILKLGGTLYVVIGFSRLREVMNAAAEAGFELVNELIWKYDFGVDTDKMQKFVCSHYSILYYVKPGTAKTYNRECRYAADNRDFLTGNSLNYFDREDVFDIPRVRRPAQEKNANKLPPELVEKLIQYSSKKGDLVCDFFMGEFTTAYAARKLGRRVIGFETNVKSFNYHEPRLKQLEEDGYEEPVTGKPYLEMHRSYPLKNQRVKAKNLLCEHWETEGRDYPTFIVERRP
jgi:site-specific DNA-methyltransferase (adenine-specific)